MRKTVGRDTMLFIIYLLLSSAAEGIADNLKDASNRADYIIIAPTAYLPIVNRLAQFRREKDGFVTKVVNIDTIMAQFGVGVSPDTAIKNSIQYAVNNWSAPKPQYFVLAGNVNVIPSHPEQETLATDYDSDVDTLLMIDQWFVNVFNSNGTMWVDACIGRLPAWDSTSLEIMVQKIIAYESESPGPWCRRAISLADFDQTGGTDFESDRNIVRKYADTLWTDTISVDVRNGSSSHLQPGQFIDLWSQGAALVTYSGHASAVTLSASRYFTVQSIDSLDNGNRLPICLLGGCDLTYDSPDGNSIPTMLMAHEGGGAVAVISSEGLTDEYTPIFFYVSIFQSLMANPDETLGQAYESAMPEWWWQLYQRQTLLGDPALHVKRLATSSSTVAQKREKRTFVLGQNYPNPFNPTTAIRYRLSVASDVNLGVYDVLGRKVRTLVDGRQAQGEHLVMFDAANLPSGVYFYSLRAGGLTETRKLVVVK